MANVDTSNATVFSFGGFFHAVMEGLKANYARHTAYSRTLKELNALTDRELVDIGLSRSMIQDIAQQHVDHI